MEQLVCEECGETLDYESNKYQYDCPECHTRGSLIREEEEEADNDSQDGNKDEVTKQEIYNECNKIFSHGGFVWDLSGDLIDVAEDEIRRSTRVSDAEVLTGQYSGGGHLGIQTGEDQKDDGIIRDPDPADLEIGRWYYVKDKAGDMNQEVPYVYWEEGLFLDRESYLTFPLSNDSDEIEAVKPIPKSPWENEE